MSKLKEVAQIIVGIVFVDFIIYFLLNLWFFNPPGGGGTPGDEFPSDYHSIF